MNCCAIILLYSISVAPSTRAVSYSPLPKTFLCATLKVGNLKGSYNINVLSLPAASHGHACMQSTIVAIRSILVQNALFNPDLCVTD